MKTRFACLECGYLLAENEKKLYCYHCGKKLVKVELSENLLSTNAEICCLFCGFLTNYFGFSRCPQCNSELNIQLRDLLHDEGIFHCKDCGFYSNEAKISICPQCQQPLEEKRMLDAMGMICEHCGFTTPEVNKKQCENCGSILNQDKRIDNYLNEDPALLRRRGTGFIIIGIIALCIVIPIMIMFTGGVLTITIGFGIMIIWYGDKLRNKARKIKVALEHRKKNPKSPN
mgnify:FL=1